ncbi:MAG: ATP-binding protein [Deltaproteobacteria bacterium]|nr:ATP-binding protein [Deltaproteobacteria bacterium]
MANRDNQDFKEIGLDIANFSRLREKGYVYVDKTEFVHKILTGTLPHVFFSRPRRFGKTLLIDTLEEAAIGRKELFSGLAIDRLRRDGEWPRSHVLRISMNAFGDDPALLEENLTGYLHSFADERGFSITASNAAFSLREVIRKLSRNFIDIPLITENTKISDGLVADKSEIIVLIDEYDAPIINNLTEPDNLKIAQKTLHGFYNALKSCENMIDRIFITGITKFSQLSLFSALNNLADITFDPLYVNVCGFSIDEINNYYSNRIDASLEVFQDPKIYGPGFTRADMIERIREWYDGYSWNGTDYLINPLSLQSLLYYKLFDNYWIRSGGMNFLNQMNINNDIFSEVFKEEAEFSGSVDIQDVHNIDPVSLMLQTGYLTVRERKDTESFSELYLTVPNKEVGMTIMRNYVDKHIIPSIIDDDNFTPELCKEFCSAFFTGQSDRAEVLLQSFLSSIPSNLHVELEALYHVFLFSVFRQSGFKTQPERKMAKGFIDLVVKSPEHGYMITEIKYAKSDNPKKKSTQSDGSTVLQETASAKDDIKLESGINAAFTQILDRNYLLPYVGGSVPVRAVAVAVCGRDNVRIRSMPGEELLARAAEYPGASRSGQASGQNK